MKSKSGDVLLRALTNASQSIVEDDIKETIEQRTKAGLKNKIIRVSSGYCCKWCDKLAGEYDADNAPDDIYRRHDNCTCVVLFKSEKGYENVHKKIVYRTVEEGLNYREIKLSKVSNSIKRKNDTIETRLVLNGNNTVYISNESNVSRAEFHKINKSLNETMKMMNVTSNRPTFVILDNKEIGNNILASYNPVHNMMFINDTIGTRSEALRLQDELGFAKSKDVNSTYVHEFFHWKDADEYRKKNGKIDKEYFEYINRISKEEIEKLINNGYNVYEISEYASSSLDDENYVEAYTEYRTKEKLK